MNPALQQDLARLLLRVTLGVLILLHGIAKLNGGLSGITGMVAGTGLPGWLGYAVLIGEVLAPLLLIAGFHARIGGALVAINMLVAVYLAHMGELGRLGSSGGWALELQAMFFVAGVAVALAGPGRFSVNGR
ncbi:DoxX family protein [Lysobacter sp. GX 14042]|uniref:DoxX family protein n=1 Tax=Lysobacter sp. GX 14042 TaxID=2907155 RepID=UPI001F48CD92|nr:DoxX family protein [Lysobacter sp. GX 14042]MCE7032608.1 DoxX family protein [Lysobacter sp. GX 14042]